MRRLAVGLLLAVALASVAGAQAPAWTRLPTGADAQNTFSFTAMVWDSVRSMPIIVGWTHEPYCFTAATNTWAVCGAQGPQTSDFHNAGYAYDPVNDRHWVSTPTNQLAYWQRATGAYVVHSTGGCGMDPALIYDPTMKRFICFGGWTTPVGTHALHTFALQPVASAIVTHTSTTGPDWHYPGDAARMTFTRAGWDAKRSQVWYVHPDGQLWTLDPTTLQWAMHATSGQKPEQVAVFGRHETADRIVAWVSKDSIADANAPALRRTYVLDRTTLVWTDLGPIGATLPTTVSNDNMMLWDPVGGRVLLHTGWNYARETWAFTMEGGTPPPTGLPADTQLQVAMTAITPPPATVPLTLQTAGTGTGTVQGGGAYAAGAPVTLTATPAAGSTFAGWTPSPCAPSFPMPAEPLTCVGTFTAITPPVAGACLPTAAKTFSPCTIPEGYDASPFAADSKDLMWTWDSLRQQLYIGMGDNANTYANQSGNNVLWSYDASTNAWAVVSTFCHAPGTVTPNHPTDYGIMVYDPSRDRVWWLGQGDGFPPGQDGAVCHQGATGWPTGSIRRNGFLAMQPGTNTWTKLSEQATYTIGGAYYDTAGDRVLTVETDNFLHAWPLATMPSVHTQLAHLGDLVPSPAYSGTTGGWIPTEYPYRVKWAWDDVGRIAYLPLVFRKLDAPGNVIESGVFMAVVNTVTKAITLRARAPIPLDVWLDPYAVMSVWDSVNQKVIYPVMSNACGKIEKMLVYHPTTDTWEDTPVPPGTHGATIAYDPVRNVTLLGGRVWCEGYVPPPLSTKVWLWRYGP